MPITRRELMKTAALGATAFLLPGGIRNARAAGGEPVLVAVFMRGAADGLHLVVPHGDPRYYQLRPQIAVPRGSEIDLDGFFGLCPQLAALHPLYQSGQLAVLHAFGSPAGTRSHFDAQDFMERAAPDDFSVYDGWLNRYLRAIGSDRSLAAVTLGDAKALALEGAAPSLSFRSLSGFRMSGEFRSERRAALETLYRSLPGTLLGRSGGELFDALDQVAAIENDSQVEYPRWYGFGKALRDAAALIRADVGVRVVALDVGGWDHHEDLPGSMDHTAPRFAEALAAFMQDLGSSAGRTAVMVTTEFGRKCQEDGSLGTDHGHGSVAFMLGAGVHGGRVLVRDGWPGLGPDELFDGRDLAVTTDFRDLFAEVLDRHMGLAQLASVFPRHPVDTGRYPGVFS